MDIRGKYRHFKGGEYEALGCCISNKTKEKFVIYKPLYNDTGMWIRQYDMFFSTVKAQEEEVKRFSLIEPSKGLITEERFYATHSETLEQIEINRIGGTNFIANI